MNDLWTEVKAMQDDLAAGRITTDAARDWAFEFGRLIGKGDKLAGLDMMLIALDATDEEFLEFINDLTEVYCLKRRFPMAKFLSQRKRVHVEEYRLVFDTELERGTGFSFPCTKDGGLLPEAISVCALGNLEWCRQSNIEPRVENCSYDYWEDAAIRCDVCGSEVVLSGFTNTCDNCLTNDVIVDYGLSGQRLAPREQWGEETGETYADIVGPEKKEWWNE